MCGAAALICLTAIGGCASSPKPRTTLKAVGDETLHLEPLFVDDFETLDNWTQLNLGDARWMAENGQMIGHWASGGAVIWCNQVFEGDVLVEFTARLLPPKEQWITQDLPAGGRNLNLYFKVRGPRGTDDILDIYQDLLREATGPNRTGDDQYRGYFLTWTWRHARLRRSPGYTLVQENLEHLPEIGQTYRFRALQQGGRLRYWINDTLIFDYVDLQPWERGRFGLTLWRSSVAVDRFEVYRVR